MQGYFVLFIFFITGILIYLEDYLGKHKLSAYLFIAIMLILIAGFREIGIDADSENYEYMYHNHFSNKLSNAVEYSFFFFSKILNYLSNDVHILFLLYAFLGVALKFIAFRTLSEYWFLPVIVYIGYYYEYHECMEIRTGVLSAFMLLSVKPLCEGKKWQALLLLAIGGFFHYSVLMLIPLFFLSNEVMSKKQRVLWGMAVPLGYFFYFSGFSLLLNIAVELPYLGPKLALYQTDAERGIIQTSLNVFTPLNFFNIALYYYLLFFHDTIVQSNKYFPFLIKLFAIGLFCFPTFAVIPVLAQRTSMQFEVATIILFTNIFYTLKPKWFGLLAVILIAFIFLNYSLPEIGTHILWKGDAK